MARKFCYVCAGMFLLALSYHLGASTAVAQGPASTVIAAYGWRESEPAHYAAVVGRTAYVLTAGDTVYPFSATIPGTAPVVAVGGSMANTLNNVCVVLANGDAYSAAYNDASWQYDGNVIGAAPTSTGRASWSQVKARYHATPGMTVTPGADKR
jgi:hypothetical protein